METTNQFAKDWYKITYKELANLMNQHWQISQSSPNNEGLPELTARIRRVAACCEVWKAVAHFNVLQKFFKGG